MVVVVYSIMCLANEKIYIGMSQDIARRKKVHFCHLKKGNSKIIGINNDVQAHGLEQFVFKIEDTMDCWNKAHNEEMRLIDKNMDAGCSYNVRGNGKKRFSKKRLEYISKLEGEA